MTPSVSLRPAASRAGERSAFPANPAFYNKATPSVTVSGLTTPPSCLRKDTVSAAQGKRRLGQGMPRTMGHSQVRRRRRAHRALRKNAPTHPTGGAKEVDVSLAFKNNFCKEGSPPLRRSGANYASRCVPRGFAPMLAAPLPEKLADATFSGALFSKSPSASKVALRSRTQFAFRQRLIVLRMTAKWTGDNDA